MARLLCITLFLSILFTFGAEAQITPEKVDTATISRIKDEGFNHSQAMDLMSYLTDVCGSRLTWSPEYKAAADWTVSKLTEWKLQNVHQETWAPSGRGWSLRHFSAHMLEPKTIPLIGYPKAWSPGTDGTVKGKAVYLDIKADSDFARYKGKLKGAIVLVSEVRDLPQNFKPFAERLQDDALLRLANADASSSRRRGGARGDTAMFRRYREDARLTSAKLEFCKKEKALAVVDGARQDGGTLMVMSASVPQSADTGRPARVNAYDEKAPAILPQVTLSAEHYDRIMRILQKGIPVKLELEIEVEFTDDMQPGLNVIGEIPGTDLKDEVVMVGAHLDSWHAGTGACDNGSGVITAMEAMRILKALDLKPRRTIRIGLWGGEEEGLYGSRAYVTQHLGERAGGAPSYGAPGGGQGSPGELTKKEGYEKFAAYFNDDNGTGKFRGIYLQGNEAVRPVFRAWLAPFQDLGASTISLSNTGGTDHLSFDAVGLPGFQFIQDPVEYGRTYHSNMDVYERVSADDMKQDAVIMASFAYTAAMRDEKLPHKPTPPARPITGSN